MGKGVCIHNRQSDGSDDFIDEDGFIGVMKTMSSVCNSGRRVNRRIMESLSARMTDRRS